MSFPGMRVEELYRGDRLGESSLLCTSRFFRERTIPRLGNLEQSERNRGGLEEAEFVVAEEDPAEGLV